MLRNFSTLLIVTGWITILISCKNKTTVSDGSEAPIRVKATTVMRHDISEFRTFTGITQFQQSEDVRATVTGYITRMPFQRGDPIRKGQEFATIRTKEQDALGEAIKVDSSLAQFTTPIRVISNASGSITRLNVVPNDFVTEGDVLATISQPNTLVVQLSVPIEYTQNVYVGMPCTVLIPGYPEIETAISGILTSTDAKGQSQHYLIRVPGRNLPENLNVQVRMTMEKVKDAMTIPREALQTNELLTDFWVLKILGDTLAVKKQVTPLLQTDSLVQIRAEEVKEGDVLVTTGGYQMADSTRVRIENQ